MCRRLKESQSGCHLSVDLQHTRRHSDEGERGCGDPRPQLGSVFYGTFDFTRKPFQWGKRYKRAEVGAGELIVYEVPLRPFTAHPNSSVGTDKQGTFLGFMDKVCSRWPAPLHDRLRVRACRLVAAQRAWGCAG